MKKQVIAIFFVLSVVIQTFAQTKNAPVKLFPVFVNGKYGYINAKGKMIIQPRFVMANKFHDGLALVTVLDKKNNFGLSAPDGSLVERQEYIDTTGKFAIPPDKYNFFNRFSEGLAGVTVNEIKDLQSGFGYIDTTGKVAIEPTFLFGKNFHEGTAEVKIRTNKSGVIDRQGKFIIPPIYDSVTAFSEDVGIGMITKNGDEPILLQKPEDVKSVLYNREGKIIAELSNLLILDGFSEGLAPIATAKGWGFIDKTGKIVIEPKRIYPIGFSEGLCPVAVDKNFGYIDKTGKTVIEPRFQAAFKFSNGLARVLINGKYGFIDKMGKIIIQTQYSYLDDFKDGLAYARQGEFNGYIDKSGKFIWKTKDKELRIIIE